MSTRLLSEMREVENAARLAMADPRAGDRLAGPPLRMNPLGVAAVLLAALAAAWALVALT